MFNSKKYPKLTVFALTIILAYIIFKDPIVSDYLIKISASSGYILIFLAGMLFSFGFTAPFAIGLFIMSNPENIFFASILGGFGALIADLLIFNFIKFSFMDEFRKLEKEKTLLKLKNLVNHTLSHKIRLYLLYVLAGFIIASPLPDEIGVMMIAGLTKIKQFVFGIVSFLLNSIGIYLLIILSH
ncbi:MAG: hypothetical protein Q8L29_02480 [archaeon]|nr:hypothetical protein [archaeon]